MHVEKYKKHAVGHLLRHYNRTACNYDNEDIDTGRTKFNYNLAPSRNESDIDYYRKRLNEVKCHQRKDVNTMCDWIVTLPQQIVNQKEEEKFFRAGYQFLAKRYGENNVISSWVHRDESGQPHMHFCFLPICWDSKHSREKVCAKEVVCLKELKAIHKEMAKHMERTFGYDIGILNGATIGGNKKVMELKAEHVQEQINMLDSVKRQNVDEIALIIKRKPSLLAEISRAIKIAMGKEPIQKEKQKNRVPERSR